MRIHYHCDHNHALAVFASGKSDLSNNRLFCPYTCGLNFVSILRAERISFGRYRGPLSIKCAYGGPETYAMGRRRHVVDKDRYLILNAGQEYWSEIDEFVPVESFCIWFRPGFAEDVHAGMTLRSDDLLDDPFLQVTGRSFFERTYTHDSLVSPHIERIRHAVGEDWLTDAHLEEMFHSLMESMLDSQRAVKTEVNRVSALKASTRHELYRRLHVSRDYLDANLTSQVLLPELAAVAELSTHHYLRMFQQLFGETPREYQSRKRMERACHLLKSTRRAVTEICLDVGFESLGSFSWDFRRRYGVPPSKYREMIQSRPVKKQTGRSGAAANPVQ